MDKSPDAFRTISEVADLLETPAHVLRFWESRFPQIKPVKRAGGRRYYRPSDVALLAGIKRLLHDEGITIRGVQKILRDQGARHVAGLSDDSAELPDLDKSLAATEDDFTDPALIAALMAEEDPTEAAGSLLRKRTPLTLTEADYGAFEDPEEDAETDDILVNQSDLPLFPGRVATPTQEAKPRTSRREDLHLPGLIRSLRPGDLAAAQPELGLLAQKLRRLRTRLSDRAEGGQD